MTQVFLDFLKGPDPKLTILSNFATDINRIITVVCAT